MGCGSCGTAAGKILGCKSNGGCSSGSCNRMNTFDWLSNLPLSDPQSACRILEVSFNNGSRKDFFRNATTTIFEKGDQIAVEGVSGFDVGTVSLTGEIVRLQLKKNKTNEWDDQFKRVLRRASDRDLEQMKINKAREPEAVIRSRAIAKQLRLNMKISEVEMQADGRKATFYYIADDRVDFRELIKVYAREFGNTHRHLVGYDYDGTGAELDKGLERLHEDRLWAEIRTAAKTNSTLRDAIDRVRVLYELSKQHDHN